MKILLGGQMSKKRKRGVVRRTVDEHGNVTIKKFKKRQSDGFSLSNIPAFQSGRLPTTIIGGIASSYAGIVYAYKQGSFEDSELGIGLFFQSFFDSFNPLIRPILAGTVGMALSILVGYTLITQGLKIKNYGKAFRQLVALTIAVLIVSTLISPFINETGFRNVNELEDWDPGYDLAGLSSPTLADILVNGLMGLLDGLSPDLAEEEVLLVEAADGHVINDDDYFLMRWKSEEKWNTETGKFTEESIDIQNFIQYFDSDFNLNDPDIARKFRMNFAYYSIGSSLSNEIVTPWNSELGITITDNNFDVRSIEGDSFFSGNPTIYRTQNENGMVSATLNELATSGFISYDAFWKQDDIASIQGNAMGIEDLRAHLLTHPSALNTRVPAPLLTTVSRVDENGQNIQLSRIETRFGQYSLPGGAQYFDGLSSDSPEELAFVNRLNYFRDILGLNTGGNPTIFEVSVAVTSFIQSAILTAYQNGELNLDLTEAQPDTATADRGHYFYYALENNLEWGLKDVIPGFINMLRALGLPTRLGTGFAGGNLLDPSTLSFKLANAHFWSEVLIPWEISPGNYRYSWAIFNPIPIFAALADDPLNFQFGKNAMPTLPNITIDSTTGLNEIGETTLDYNMQIFGENFEYIISVDYNGIPARNTILEVYLMDEEVDISDPAGIFNNLGQLAEFKVINLVTNESGIATLSGQVNFEGILTIDQNETFSREILPLNLLNFEENTGDTNLYGLFIKSGLSFEVSPAGWLQDGYFEMEILEINYLFEELDWTEYPAVYEIYPSLNYTISGRLLKTADDQPISNQDVTLMMYDDEGYQAISEDLTSLRALNGLATEPTNQIVHDQSITAQTNATGHVEWVIQFGYNFPVPAENHLYVFLLYWEGSLVYTEDPLVVWVRSQISMDLDVNETQVGLNGIVQEYTGSIVETYEFNFTLTQIFEKELDPDNPDNGTISGETVYLVMYNEANYLALDFDSLVIETINQNNLLAEHNFPGLFINDYTFEQQTDSNGQTLWQINFGGINGPLGTNALTETYYFFVVYEAYNQTTGNQIIHTSNIVIALQIADGTVEYTGNFTSDHVVSNHNQTIYWDSSVELTSNNQPIEGVNVTLYLVDFWNYNSSYQGQRPSSWNEFKEAILNDNSYLKYLLSTGLTDQDGLLNQIIAVVAQNYAVSYYYLIIVIEDFEIFEIVNLDNSDQNFIYVRKSSGQYTPLFQPNNFNIVVLESIERRRIN
jgi:hypothetical protein